MPRPATRDEVLRRYPRIVSHLIAESLGYFLPEAAAGAVLAVLEKRGCACEWYCHMSGVSGRSLEETVLTPCGAPSVTGATTGGSWPSTSRHGCWFTVS